MKKYYIAVLLAAIVSISANAQIKIGYMNPSEVLSQLDEVAAVEEEIQTLIETRDADLIAKSTQLQQDLATYEEGMAVLSAEARATKEQELLDRNTELEDERENYLNEIRQKRLQLMSPILDEMDAAIKTVATEMGLDLVLNENTSYGDAIVFYSAEERLNITSQVLAILKAE
ncbi:MAG: OmpH family outer membrane protein [Balneolaceae bacterium]|nr:OmpH family outer membrane protein [Balneolaceae bacterium]MBO6547624.1 OmpH family outer membrane protein [Balneolaceae bacterium]MBO6648135.1 OmpH family outer membrane protein [Balneolaceae bacterium]